MPVDEDINLDKPITDQHIAKLEKDADRMESAADKAEQAEIKMAANAKKFEEHTEKISQNAQRAANELLSAEKFMSGGSPLARLGGDIEFPEIETNVLGMPQTGKTVLPTSGRRSAQGVGLGPVSGISVDAIEAMRAEQERIQKEAEERQKEEHRKILEQMRKMQEEMNHMKQQMSKAQELTHEGMSAIFHPKQLISGKIGNLASMITKGSMPLMVISFIYELGKEIYEQVLSEVSKMFGPGGKYDTRVLVLEAAKTVSNLEKMVQINTGQVYFTSDTSEILRQGAYSGATVSTRDALINHRNFNRLQI